MSRTKHATLRYTAMRLGIFTGCAAAVAVLAELGAIPEGIGRSHPLWILLLALVVSAPLSYILLRRQRDAMSEQIVGGMDRVRQRLHDSSSQEDAVDEATRRAEQPSASGRGRLSES